MLTMLRRGRTPVRSAHTAILRYAQGCVPYIKLLSLHEYRSVRQKRAIAKFELTTKRGETLTVLNHPIVHVPKKEFDLMNDFQKHVDV